MNTETRYNEKSTEYSKRAGQTRSRRSAAGRYPTKAQRDAYKRLVQRDGWKNVTKEDAELLSTCQWLTYSQRSEIAAKFTTI